MGGVFVRQGRGRFSEDVRTLFFYATKETNWCGGPASLVDALRLLGASLAARLRLAASNGTKSPVKTFLDFQPQIQVCTYFSPLERCRCARSGMERRFFYFFRFFVLNVCHNKSTLMLKQDDEQSKTGTKKKDNQESKSLPGTQARHWGFSCVLRANSINICFLNILFVVGLLD